VDPRDRKKLLALTKYAIENFSQGDWLVLGQLTNQLSRIQDHPRLLRSLDFGDDDYVSCATEVMSKLFEDPETNVSEIVDHFDVDIWYRQKYPDKAEKLFRGPKANAPKFWKPGLLRVFVSHLASSRKKVALLKTELEGRGISAFIAHEDIEPSSEWQVEIEAGLASMDLMIALVEPGFRESSWTDQEVGFALGRGVDVIPLLAGQDPHGFIAKIQGLQVKGKLPDPVAEELFRLLLRKPAHRTKLLQGLSAALASSGSSARVERLRNMVDLLTGP
jgi:hypothetical protein